MYSKIFLKVFRNLFEVFKAHPKRIQDILTCIAGISLASFEKKIGTFSEVLRDLSKST